MSTMKNPSIPVVAQMPDGFDMNKENRTVYISSRISKLGVNIPSINLPPVVTCRLNAPCAKCTAKGGGCYALRGHWLYKAVRENLWNNLALYKKNPTAFFDDIIYKTRINKYVRWFSSGDIVDIEFLKGMVKVAKKNKETKYLCFTKKFELVNEYLSKGGKIPSNLKIVFSTWRDFIPNNPYNLPMTYVMFKGGKNKAEKEANEKSNALIPHDAIPCIGDCSSCVGCWSLKKGQSVVFKKH